MMDNHEISPHPPGEDEIDVKEIWRILRSNRKSIIIIFLSVLTLTIAMTLTTEPIFKATTIVLIKESNNDPSSFVFDFGVNGAKQRLKNEMEVLQSYSLHREVVRSLIEDGSAKELALFGTKYTRHRYRLIDDLMEWIGKPAETFILPSDLSVRQQNRIVRQLRKAFKVYNVRETDVLQISVSSTDGDDAILLANRISDIYQDLDIADGQGEMYFMRTFLDSQIAKYEQRLADAEDSLQQFKSEFKIYSLDGSAELLLKDLTGYESTYFTNIAELEVSQNSIEYLRLQLSENERALIEQITNTDSPMIVALRFRIAEMEAQKIQQMVDEGWGDDSFQAKDFNRRIAEMKANLTGITESLILSGWSEEDPFEASHEIFNRIVDAQIEIHATRARASEYKKLVDRMSLRLTNLPAQTLQFARLQRELMLNEQLYVTMQQKFEESKITEAGQRGKVRLLDPAISADLVKPNKPLNIVIGIVMALVLGVGFAFGVEYLDNTVKAIEHLERKGLTVLGVIPDMGDQRNLKKTGPSKGGTDFQRRMITHEDPKSPISESFRSLRTNISYAKPDEKIKSILVSSPLPGEGKSTTVVNLAIAFAQLRKRTLLIDADLRKPVQHNVFELERSPGISDYLMGDVEDFDSIIRTTNIPGLHLVTAGGLPPNPSELLGSQKMSDLIGRLEKEWDIVLLDSPPIVAVTDASMISAEIDAIVMVVKAGQTDRMAADRAIDTLRSVNAPLIGAVLNAAKPETLSGKYAYYYSYYSYSYYSNENK
jgi:capsular exopolysaccharide synthesis family protein